MPWPKETAACERPSKATRAQSLRIAAKRDCRVLVECPVRKMDSGWRTLEGFIQVEVELHPPRLRRRLSLLKGKP